MECLLAVGFIGLQNFVLGRPLEGFFVTRTIVATLGAIIASLVKVLEGFRVISGRHDEFANTHSGHFLDKTWIAVCDDNS